jgi:hypothetical protein
MATDYTDFADKNFSDPKFEIGLSDGSLSLRDKANSKAQKLSGSAEFKLEVPNWRFKSIHSFLESWNMKSFGNRSAFLF